MADKPVNYSQAVTFPDPADKVWDILLHFDDPRIYGDMTADVVPADSSGYKGTINVNGTELRLSAKPYDIKMISDDLRIGIRVKPAGQICTVLAACSCSDNAPFTMDKSDLNDMLSGLDRILHEEYPLPSDDTEEDAPAEEEHAIPASGDEDGAPSAAPAEPAAEDNTESAAEDTTESAEEDTSGPAEADTAEPAAEDISEPVAEDTSVSVAEDISEPVAKNATGLAAEDTAAQTQEEISQAPKGSGPAVQPDEKSPLSAQEEHQSDAAETTVRIGEVLPVLSSSPKKKKRTRSSSGKHSEKKSGNNAEKKTGKKIRAVAAVLLLVALVAGAAVFIIKGLGKSGILPDNGSSSGSEKVSLTSALSVRPGDSRSDIEDLLGKPSSGSGDTAVYQSSELTDYGTPAVAVQVVYEEEKASRVTVLDLERASAVGEVTGSSLSEASSPADLDSLAGTSPSMVRSFALNGDTVTEYHYGYLDPRMNFSPYWKGQLWAASVSGGITECGTGYAYDGTDPLFHSEMTGPLLAQYSSFDDYLSDFLGLQFCLRMRSQPGREEALKAIPSLSESGNADETTLYRGTSAEMTDDGSPVWAYTMGFGKRGDFVLFSAVNRRLWQKEGMLNASALGSIRSGMPFTEAMRCMRVLPSMVYIDYSYITFGFGRYLQDSDVLTEQFEFCLRFTLTDDILESVYDNTGTHLDLD